MVVVLESFGVVTLFNLSTPEIKTKLTTEIYIILIAI